MIQWKLGCRSRKQKQSRSQSFVPLDQRSENASSGSNHYERTKEITEYSGYPFSSPEAALLLVSTKNRDLWQTSGQVQHRKSAIHGLPITLRMFRVKFDKSDWFWSQSIVFTKPFKTGMSLERARGRDSWCWPKGARPLGTRMLVILLTAHLHLWRMPEMVAPRALVFRPLVKGNEALGTRLKQKRKNQPIARPGIEHCHWFILPFLLASPTMQFSLDRKRRSHKQNQCSASDSVGLIFTRSYRFTLLITTPTTTTTPSLVKTSLYWFIAHSIHICNITRIYTNSIFCP